MLPSPFLIRSSSFFGLPFLDEKWMICTQNVSKLWIFGLSFVISIRLVNSTHFRSFHKTKTNCTLCDYLHALISKRIRITYCILIHFSTLPTLWSICIYWNRRVVAFLTGFLHTSQAVAWSDFPISTLLCKSAILKVPSNLPSTLLLALQEQFCTGTVEPRARQQLATESRRQL